MMKPVNVNAVKAISGIPIELVREVEEDAKKGFETLVGHLGQGKEYLGWIEIPDQDHSKLFDKIQATVDRLRNISEVIVVIGIGGSYLGARAVIEALNFQKDENFPKILFAGNNIDVIYLSTLLKEVKHKDFSVVVISKSGNTIEPAISFRIFREILENKYGNKASEHIVAVTDKAKGSLKKSADLNGYETYEVPDNVGGRYSVLTPVGLLPIALAGIDIKKLLQGAKAMKDEILNVQSPLKNSAVNYALARNILYAAGYNVELMVCYIDCMRYFIEWWKQLFAESEGKDLSGIFPAGAIYSTDLHSLGQFVQGGSRILFETVVNIEKVSEHISIPKVDNDIDNLNYIAGRGIHDINAIAQKAVTKAHEDANIPNIIINMPQLNEFYLGQLIYMFEFACGISGYTLDINPFDQPDVEAYKKKMSELLKKPK